MIQAPSHGACRIQLSERISRGPEENQICGSRYEKATYVSDQQFQTSCPLNCASIQIEMASGAILQVDQTASPDKDAFYGTSDNAVKTQIWIAISTYILVAIIKKELK